MRLFVAVPLPEKIRSNLAKLRADFSDLPAKWVEEENLHMTLVFLGETREKEATEVTETMNTAAQGLEPARLKTSKLVLLPNERKPHVLAAELKGETDKLARLSEEIKKGLSEKEINFDQKPFRSHVTLARIKRLSAAERNTFKDQVRNYNLPRLEFEVDRIELVESQLTPNGPIYKVNNSANLGR